MNRSLLVRGLAAASALAVLAGAGAAQSSLFTIAEGRTRAAGDVNGDGLGDILVSHYHWTAEGTFVRLVSGAGGSTLFEWTPPPAWDFEEFGTSADAGGDVDGDGVPDVVVGASQALGWNGPPELSAGYVKVFSGADGSELRTLRGTSSGDAFGGSVAFLGDLDGDGKDELAVGARQTTYYSNGWSFGPGYVTVFRGSDGSVLHHLPGPGSMLNEFGTTVRAAGDVDADGVGDLIVGDPGCWFHSATTYVHVYSGASGLLLHAVVGPTNFNAGAIGRQLTAAGDIDRDGFADFGYQRVGGIVRPYEILFVSGATGSVLRSVLHPTCATCLIGDSLHELGDVDADGFVDVGFVADNGPLPQTVYVLSGRDGTFLHELSGPFWSMGEVGDVDADGYADFSAVRPGVTAVYSGCDGSWTSYGTGCPGTGGLVPELSVRGCPTPGRTLYLAVEGGLAGAEARLYVGSWQATPPGGAPCPLLVEPVAIHPVTHAVPRTTLAADGTGEIPFRIPSGIPAGTVYTAQVRVADPASPTGYAATQGVEITVR